MLLTTGTIVGATPLTVNFVKIVFTWLKIDVTLVTTVALFDAQRAQNVSSMKTATRNLKFIISFYIGEVSFASHIMFHMK